MPINGDTYQFDERSINLSPDMPGVYALLYNGDIIYYGSSSTNIRTRLISHLKGNMGKCTKNATHYKREPHIEPLMRERKLMREFRLINKRFPLCNDVMP